MGYLIKATLGAALFFGDVAILLMSASVIGGLIGAVVFLAEG
jgi:hypothetical protein